MLHNVFMNLQIAVIAAKLKQVLLDQIIVLNFRKHVLARFH